MRIGIVGIGGVGGFIGAKLSAAYGIDSEHEIVLIARPSSAEAIRHNGLHLETTDGVEISYPKTVYSDPSIVGSLDVLICATKSYDLASSIEGLKASIGPNTLILPLLNGVSSQESIKSVLPSALVLDGCIFIVSDLVAPGHIKHFGGKHRLSFGSSAIPNTSMEKLQAAFAGADINSKLEDDIAAVVWEKFIFISSVASLTTSTDMVLGEIMDDNLLSTKMTHLLEEAYLLAQRKGVDVNPNIVANSLSSMKKLPFETTSSMQRDFRRGKKSELENLCGYIVREGKRLDLDTPTFHSVYSDLRKR